MYCLVDNVCVCVCVCVCVWQRERRGGGGGGREGESRHLCILHLGYIFLTVTSYAATGRGHVISRETVRRRLRQHGIGAYRPFKGLV